LVLEHINFTTIGIRDEGKDVEDRKFYDKVRDREVQWQRKLRFMIKEGEDVAGATRSSQDLAG